MKHLKNLFAGLWITIKRHPFTFIWNAVVPPLLLYFMYETQYYHAMLVFGSIMLFLAGLGESVRLATQKMYKRLTGYTSDELMQLTLTHSLIQVKDQLKTTAKSKSEKVEEKLTDEKAASGKVISLAEQMKNKLQ